ncbi:MAG TPA: CDP-archaeol synthase [Patescibacteria group bacterium]
MFRDLFFVYWFFLPAGLANIAAFASSKIPFIKQFNYPVDFYLKIKGKRILGNHKTIRGFLFGILAGIATVYFQILMYNNVEWLRNVLSIDYNFIDPVIFGSLLGFGALAGDAMKSFFKRQMGIIPGRSWVPFDQTDYIIGGIIFSWFYFPLTLYQYMLLFMVWVLLHPLTTFLGYLLRLRRHPL